MSFWEQKSDISPGRTFFSCAVDEIEMFIRHWSFIKNKRLLRRCFPVNSAEFLRTSFSIEHHRWLLLHRAQLKKIKNILSIFGLPYFIVHNPKLNAACLLYGLYTGCSTKEATDRFVCRAL